MRHKKKGRSLNRTSSHFKAMFNNMMCSLIKYEIIKTTLAKAKELRIFIEPLITLSKTDNVSNRRLVFSKLRNNFIVSKLFNDIAPHFLNRSGGYTQILKCGYRSGDNSKIAYIQFVDRNIEKNSV